MRKSDSRSPSPVVRERTKSLTKVQDTTSQTKKMLSKTEDAAGAAPPDGDLYRWLGREFFLYYFYAAPVVIYMFYHASSHSQMYGRAGSEDVIALPRMNKPYLPYSNGLDLSDRQWNEFRKFIPLIVIGSLVYAAVSQGARAFFASKFPSPRGIDSPANKGKVAALSDTAHAAQLVFYCVVNIIAVLFLHGFDLVWIVLIGLANFAIGRVLGRSKITIPLTWLLNCVVLYYLDSTNGFRNGFSMLGLSEWLPNSGIISRHGLIPWATYWKMTMLRNIAFNCDYVWMLRERKLQIDPSSGKHNALMIAQEVHRPLKEYSLWAFFAYTLYLPLFLAGPIISFNAFSAQVRQSQNTYSVKDVARMLVKVLVIIFCLEVALHYVYYHAFNEYHLWKYRLNPVDVALTGFITLNFMYTKFTIIWRLFRVWALWDGIDTQENMLRCVNNNNTFAGFWRSWHASFNKWIVRYLYIPMGGSQTFSACGVRVPKIVFTVWIIFSFVGLWHDLLSRWLAWAWCNCVGLILEMGLTVLFTKHRAFAWLRAKPYWRNVVAAGGALNIFLLMLANLAILYGFRDTPWFLKNAFWGRNGEGFPVFVLAFLLMYVGVNIMHEVRRLEAEANKTQRY